jgi:hypothetical protein
MARIQIREGDWFAVPLRSSGFGAVLVARANPEGVLLGYFFRPRSERLPSLDGLRNLGLASAVLVAKFGHLGITSGAWPLLGRLDGWDRLRWPMPVFGRLEELSGRAFRVFYNNDDPNGWLRDEPTSINDALQLPRDRLLGAGAAEIVLTKLLAS